MKMQNEEGDLKFILNSPFFSYLLLLENYKENYLNIEISFIFKSDVFEVITCLDSSMFRSSSPLPYLFLNMRIINAWNHSILVTYILTFYILTFFDQMRNNLTFKFSFSGKRL